jgi:hypothetical protein
MKKKFINHVIIQKSEEVRDTEYDLKSYLRCRLEQANK